MEKLVEEGYTQLGLRMANIGVILGYISKVKWKFNFKNLELVLYSELLKDFTNNTKNKQHLQDILSIIMTMTINR